VSNNHVAVDHHARGKEGVHRFITGSLTYTSGDMKEIKLLTPEGERSFSVQHGESKLSGMKEGTPRPALDDHAALTHALICMR
jgi:hypothetical protein